MANENLSDFLSHSNKYPGYQWRAVTSETSHAISMPKPSHEIWYFMGS